MIPWWFSFWICLWPINSIEKVIAYMWAISFRCFFLCFSWGWMNGNYVGGNSFYAGGIASS